MALETWNAFNTTTRAQVGRVNVHGYQYGDGRRDLLRTAVGNKSLWNSEYGEDDSTGMRLASNLNLDFEYLRPTAWVYWQPLDSGGWGLIRSNPGDNWIGEVNPKYFVLAQYSRHIRQGMTIINGGSRNTIAAYDQPGKKLVIVTTNYGTAQSITHDLSAFSFLGGSIRRWTTQTGVGDKYALRNDLSLSGKRLTAFFPANTVQTFEIPVAYQTGTPWTAWQTARFAGNATTPAIAGETADFDKDGKPNLLEYTTGTDPRAFSSSPTIVTHEGRLSIRFTRNTAAADVTLTVQASNDLNVWTDLARSTGGNPLIAIANGVVVTETGTDSLRTVHVSDATPTVGQLPPRRMMRLHMSK
jgi:hypothetical protein